MCPILCLPLLQTLNEYPRDVNSYTKGKAIIEPTTVFRGHTSVVGVRGCLHTYMHDSESHSCYRMWTGMQQETISLGVLEMTKGL